MVTTCGVGTYLHTPCFGALVGGDASAIPHRQANGWPFSTGGGAGQNYRRTCRHTVVVPRKNIHKMRVSEVHIYGTT